MPSKTEEYLALAQRTANGLTRYWESWTDYLTTASRLYKYPFADQLMMHNILARVSDQCDIDTDYSETPKFEGPWEPFVRDFDPTLNFKLTKSDEIPIFDEISELKKATRDEHLKVDVSNIDSVFR